MMIAAAPGCDIDAGEGMLCICWLAKPITKRLCRWAWSWLSLSFPLCEALETWLGVIYVWSAQPRDGGPRMFNWRKPALDENLLDDPMLRWMYADLITVQSFIRKSSFQSTHRFPSLYYKIESRAYKRKRTLQIYFLQSAPCLLWAIFGQS